MAIIVETYEENTRVMKQNSEMLQEVLRQVRLLSAHFGIVDEGEIDEAREMDAKQDNPNSRIYQVFDDLSTPTHPKIDAENCDEELEEQQIQSIQDIERFDSHKDEATRQDLFEERPLFFSNAHKPIFHYEIPGVPSLTNQMPSQCASTLIKRHFARLLILEKWQESILKGNGRLRLTELEQELQRVLQQAIKDDIKVYAAILKNHGDTFLNISKWYNIVSSPLVISFPGKAVDVGFGDKVALDELFKANATDDNDDMDLFGMKLCRKRGISEEKFSNVFLWYYGQKESHFVVELTYIYGITSYDIRIGSWNFATVTQIVYNMVEEVYAKGGNITRECGPVKGENSIIVVMKDPSDYIFELIQRASSHKPLCQVMLCVDDLDRSVKLCEKALGMKLVKKVDKPKYKSFISMEGHAKEQKFEIIVLTCNSSVMEYTGDNAKVELEPIFKFLPFYHGCYNNLQKSISKDKVLALGRGSVMNQHQQRVKLRRKLQVGNVAYERYISASTQYLDEDNSLILKIVENQNSGKLSECAENQARLQRNLVYLAAVLDSRPQPSTRNAQFQSNGIRQPRGGHYMQHQQAQQMMQQSLKAARSSMLYAEQPFSALHCKRNKLCTLRPNRDEIQSHDALRRLP
ncbi:hypothetical protein GQ457_14G019290 [Hibiscus cannabinus]